MDYRVLEIAATDLFDRGAMVAHFRKLARWLDGKERAEAVAADSQWYRAPVVETADDVDADAGAAVASAPNRPAGG